MLVRTVGVVGGMGVLGAAAGALWEAIWDAPTGVVWQGEWLLYPSGPDLGFDAVALYVVIGFAAGLLVGVALALFLVGRELITLLGVCVGSVLAAWVMFATGQALGPPDPQVLAQRLDDFETLPAQLDVGEATRFAPFGSTASLAWPLGSVLGLGLTMLVTDGRRRRPSGPSNPRTNDGDVSPTG